MHFLMLVAVIPFMPPHGLLMQVIDRPLRPEHCSVAWFFNAGNASLLADQLPVAILAYHKGLELDPNDTGVRENLEYARQRVQYPPGSRGRPETDWWPAWLYRPSAFQVLLLAVGLHALGCAVFTRWYMMRRRLLLTYAGISCVLAVACGCYWLYLEEGLAWRTTHPLVVIRVDKSALRKGNGPSYPVNPDLPLLARGMEARQLHARGDWLQVIFASGTVGWISRAAALVDD